jgi:predicted GIY-YIG superfamily endonuclease
MFYTYVLRCRDSDLYIGSALDLRERQLKTGFRRAYLKRRLGHYTRTPARNASRSDAGAAASRTIFLFARERNNLQK